MTDGRRHSVDLPLSRTLVALRRVRSLRDPSTNYVTKSSPFVDNLTWEPDSGYGFSLGLRNGGLSNQSPLRCHSFGLKETREEEIPSDPELDFSVRETEFKFNKLGRVGKRRSDSLRTKHTEESCFNRANGGVSYRNKSFDHRHDTNHERALDLVCVPPSATHSEDVVNALGSAQLDRDCTVIKQKSGYSKHLKSSRAVVDVESNVTSPFPSVSDGRMDGSSGGTSLFASEEVDIVGPNHRGCGISCCWSTPRFRQSDLPSDVEDHPLLSGEVGELSLSEPETSCTYVKRETAQYSDSPRSLSQKFRPKSFNELVGQHVVARSLLNAISKGKITSFYLFHGPRGTGKTSTSRIFAAALNCLSLEERGPCGLCRECVLFLSGRSRDIKEVDPAKINRTGRVRSLLKSASRTPVSSRYKVFIIDECQLLQAETWANFLSSLDDLPRHAVFVMITADLDNLPRSVVSRCQRYHFPKIKDADIVHRLTRICIEEGLDFDEVALNFIGAKSNGSLRDAEMMLDQLSLLGKKITILSAYELIGIVSDDELLELLDLALSSDTCNTVIRARDLMRSRVDPMQLISQLANLIMDILAGRCETGNSEVGRNFCGRHTSEMDLQKLRHALRILSETEKQLRTSKNQTTWLTVALLQLSSVESFSSDGNDSRACLGTTQQRDDGFCSISSTGGSQKHSVSCFCYDNKSRSSEVHPDGKDQLEIIWSKAIGKCQSKSLRSFLRKGGKLSSICVNQGMAVAEVEFSRPDYVSKAEKSWKLIASSLQLVLGCNVEIRINLVPCSSAVKVNKPSSFSFLSCSRRKNSTSEDCTDQSDSSDFSSRRAKKRGESIKTYSSDPGPQFSPMSSHCKEGATTIRNSEGNALCSGKSMSLRSNQDDQENGPQVRAGSSKEEDENQERQDFPIQEPENQSSCFSKTLRFQRRLRSSSDSSRTICLRIQPHNKLELATPQMAPLETVFCPNDPYIPCSSSNTFSNSSGDDAAGRLEKESGNDTKPHCWKAPKIPLRKAWQLRPQHLLPCATAK